MAKTATPVRGATPAPRTGAKQVAPASKPADVKPAAKPEKPPPNFRVKLGRVRLLQENGTYADHLDVHAANEQEAVKIFCEAAGVQCDLHCCPESGKLLQARPRSEHTPKVSKL